MNKRAENVIGAMALAIADGIRRAVQVPAGETGEAAAAIALIGFAPGLSIERLRRALLLTHSGAVRLVDRLVDADLVKRIPAAHDARAVALTLTSAGQQAWFEILAARNGGLTSALSALSDSELQQFGALAGKVLTSLVRDEDHACHLCRLCNYRICSDCPVEAGLAP